MIGTDLLVLIGTDLANNQPVTTKYMHFAKEQGTRIVVVNPFREPALDRYWVPSVAKSALWGTPLMDDFFAVRPGGDIAFMIGVLKALDARSLFDEAFIAERTVGFEALREEARALEWSVISDAAGLPREEIERFAELYGAADRAVLLYSMGLTQYAFGVDNVKMVVNLALSRGNIGREKTGIIPIRGHSGRAGHRRVRRRFRQAAGRRRHQRRELREIRSGVGPRDSAQKGAQGGARARRLGARRDRSACTSSAATSSTPCPIRKTRAAAFSARACASTRTSCSTPRRWSTPRSWCSSCRRRRATSRAAPRPRPSGACATRRRSTIPTASTSPRRAPSGRFPRSSAARSCPANKSLFAWQSPADVRAEMGRTMPLYAGIEGLAAEGQWVQWGGARLGQNGFPNMPDGRARFSTVPIPTPALPAGKLMLATRRGKQFNSITYGQKDPITASKRARRRALLRRRSGGARHRRRRARRPALRRRRHGSDGAHRPVPAQARAGLLARGQRAVRRASYDPVSGEPDYNAVVSVERAATGSRTSAAASSPHAAPPGAAAAPSPTRASSGRR